MNAPLNRTSPSAETLEKIRAAVGPKGVVEGDDTAPFLNEWRERWPGSAALIVTPASTAEVADVLRICAAEGVAVTPQGGNTGLVGGQIPFGPEILLSLKRMRAVRDVSPADNAMTVEAGLTLQEAQDIAADVDRLFPLSIGSEGTCQIGGVISTNAGGVNVLRYGNTRDLVLGLEVVTASGEIWDGLKVLRKDNTGYDLKQLFIGGEGTLGIVTAAVVKLFPRPRRVSTAFVGVPSARAAVDLLSYAQGATGGQTTSFELIGRLGVELAVKHIPGVRDPLAEPHPWYVLAEFSAGAGDLQSVVEEMLADAIEKGIASDAVIAVNEQQAHDFWRLRHSLSEAISGAGLGARHDVSAPTARIPEFLEEAGAVVHSIAADARIVAFGHVGDGNVHYDVVAPDGAPKDALNDKRERIESAVYDVIARFNGSISAEHGVGRQRREAIAARKSSVEMDMMRAVKAALDPQGIMNPGKML